MNEARESSSPSDTGPWHAAGAPIKNRLVTGLLLAFCCWHAGFLVYAIFPKPVGKEVPNQPGLDLYRLAVSGSQEWNMFETIPTLHSMDARLVGKDGAGNEITLGCILPGFEPYPKPELSRYYVGLNRLLSIEAYRDAYLRKMAKLLLAHQGPKEGKNWSLVVDAEYTGLLFHGRRDRNLTVPATMSFPLPSPSGNSL